jgi:Na+-driven multidrug efflux pump
MASGPRDLTTGPIGRTLLVFAVPTLASSIVQSLNGSVNAIWVGRFLGEGALAATSNANLVMFLLMAFVFGFGMAATVLIGQAFGRRDADGARRVIGTALGGFLPVAGGIAVLGWVGAPALLHLLATPADAVPFALAYLRVIFLAMPGILILIVLMMGLRGSGDAMTPLWFMLVAVLLDASLNPVFILGLGPAQPIARPINQHASWSFILFGVTMVLFGTVRANGAVVGPLVILAIGLFPVRFGIVFALRHWFGSDALWISFPASSFVNMAMAVAFYLHGGWRKGRMHVAAPLKECVEEAIASAEPGGRMNPAG